MSPWLGRRRRWRRGWCRSKRSRTGQRRVDSRQQGHYPYAAVAPFRVSFTSCMPGQLLHQTKRSPGVAVSTHTRGPPYPLLPARFLRSVADHLAGEASTLRRMQVCDARPFTPGTWVGQTRQGSSRRTSESSLRRSWGVTGGLEKRGG